MNSDTSLPSSRRTSLFVVSGIVLIVLASAGIALLLKNHHSSVGSNAPATKRQAIIEVGTNGFMPATITVKAGTEVVWRNMDTAPHAIASNPYPADSSVPGLHSQTISPGGSYTYAPSASGNISYHDELQPSHNGTITVVR